jgi:hypothetical protein
MSTTISDCWPDDIKVDVLTPLAILKVQEGLLAQKTRGMLQAGLATTESENLVQHQLDLIAPSLNFYRERLLTATHDRVMLYPVTVMAEAFSPKPLLHPVMEAAWVYKQMFAPPTNVRKAATDEEFLSLVREVLKSERVRALISSLLARINDPNPSPAGNGPVDQEKQTKTTQKEGE